MEEGESCRSSLTSSTSGVLDKLSDGELGAFYINKEKRPELEENDDTLSFEEILRKCREKARNHQIMEHYRNSCSCSEYYDNRRRVVLLPLVPPSFVNVSPDVAYTSDVATTTTADNDIDDELDEKMAADIAYKQSFLPRYKVDYEDQADDSDDDDDDDDSSSSVNSILDLDDDDDDSVYYGLDVEEMYKHYWKLEKKVPTKKKSDDNASTKSKKEEEEAQADEEDALLNSLRRQLFVSC